MEHKSKKRWLIVAQVDHMSGESAGTAIEPLYAAGARNVQVISSVTKKNRPGLVFMIDCSDECIDSVESCMVRELGVTGWHRLQTEHCYISVSTESKTMEILAGEHRFPFCAVRKISSADSSYVRPENDSCAELRQLLREKCGLEVSLELVRQKISYAFLSGESTITF